MTQEEFSEVLWEKYPICFKEKVHIETDLGWNLLIDDMFAEIEIFLISISDKYPEQYLPEVYQIQEKFGGMKAYLKFHTTLDDREVKRLDEIIREHERKSLNICSMCGSPGKCETAGGEYLLKTLCPLCKGIGQIQ